MSLLVEMDNNDDNQRIMEDIIAGGDGSTNFPTYTEEEGTQADQFLNMSTAEEGDTRAENSDTAAAEDNAECSGEVSGISCLNNIIITNSLTPIRTYTLYYHNVLINNDSCFCSPLDRRRKRLREGVHK